MVQLLTRSAPPAPRKNAPALRTPAGAALPHDQVRGRMVDRERAARAGDGGENGLRAAIVGFRAGDEAVRSEQVQGVAGGDQRGVAVVGVAELQRRDASAEAG